MLNRLREYAEWIDLADNREELGKIYEDMVGHDLDTDAPDATLEDLRDLCRDCLREECYSLGIHCEDVLNPCVTDDARSNGPWSLA